MRVTDRPGIRAGSWSQSGMLRVDGANRGGVPALVTQVSFWDPDDKRQRPAGIYTVSFDVDTQMLPSNSGYRHANPVATVKFSSEGNTIRRRFSVVNGTSISGPCDHVEVRVVDDSIPPGDPALKFDYVVTITVAPFTRPPRGSPLYLRGTLEPLVIVGGAATNVAVPEDAGVVSACVFADSVDGGVGHVNQRTDAALIASYPAGPPEFVALFPGCSNIQVANSAGGGTHVTFGVLFGIDG